MNELNEALKETYERAINETLHGLKVYSRDVNLPKSLEEKYVPYTVILERGYTDATTIISGMKTTHRFSILSNHIFECSKHGVETKFDLSIAQRNSRFLILDKYEYHKKTQIILLHLPNNKDWKLFQNLRIDILDNVIEECHKRFENECEQKVVPQIASKEWIERCSAPLGMDEKGNLFDLNILLKFELRKISTANFRNLYHQIIYVNSIPELQNRLNGNIETIREDDGFLAYGYIDNQDELSFKVLCSANIRDNKLSRGNFNESTDITIKRSQLDDCDFINLDECEFEISDIYNYILNINNNYKAENTQIEEMRTITFFDNIRDHNFPDNVQVILYKEGLEAELAWVKCLKYDNNEFFGKLLNEPSKDYGIHYGNIISFKAMSQNGNVQCVCICKS